VFGVGLDELQVPVDSYIDALGHESQSCISQLITVLLAVKLMFDMLPIRFGNEVGSFCHYCAGFVGRLYM